MPLSTRKILLSFFLFLGVELSCFAQSSTKATGNYTKATSKTTTSGTKPAGATKPASKPGKATAPIVDIRKAVEIPEFVPDAAFEVYDVIHSSKGIGTEKVKAELWLYCQPGYELKYAIDGKKNAADIFEDYWRSGEGLTPGFTIDLGEITYVDHIVIWNSVEADSLKGRNFFIYTGSHDIVFKTSPIEQEPAAGNKKFLMKNVAGYSPIGMGENPDAPVPEKPLGPYLWPTEKESFVVPIKRSLKKISISLQKDGILATPLTLQELEIYGTVFN